MQKLAPRNAAAVDIAPLVLDRASAIVTAADVGCCVSGEDSER